MVNSDIAIIQLFVKSPPFSFGYDVPSFDNIECVLDSLNAIDAMSVNSPAIVPMLIDTSVLFVVGGRDGWRAVRHPGGVWVGAYLDRDCGRGLGTMFGAICVLDEGGMRGGGGVVYGVGGRGWGRRGCVERGWLWRVWVWRWGPGAWRSRR